MAAIQNVVLHDRQTVPAAVTLVPHNVVQGVATVAERKGIPVGEMRLSISNRRSASGRFKPTIKLVAPIVENIMINGVERAEVVDTAYGQIHFDFGERTTQEFRDNFVGLLQSSLNKNVVLVNDTVVHLTGVY